MNPWWEETVIYQIYPRSFQDSNGDGIGDIRGIINRLQYIQDLGVGAIWLSPIFTSPMADFGYDISDYRGIDPIFGTLADVRELIATAHRMGLKVLFDMVLNHTSDQHAWFQESRASKDSKKKDYYIWSDTIPNNWYSAFGGKGWSFDSVRGQYYFHSFLREQPDLNWRNEETVLAIFDEVGFWLEEGVDGFRLDVINCIIKDDSFRSNPPMVGSRLRPYDMQRHIFDRNRPESHQKLRKFRKCIDTYDERMLVGEIMVERPGEPEMAASYLGKNKDELNLTFDFSLIELPFDARKWQTAAQRWYEAVGRQRWPTWVLNNHDVKRSITRYGNNTAKAKLATFFLLTQRGTVFLYYGEELGLLNSVVSHKEMNDPVGLRYWPVKVGRDGERGPMLWDASEKHGFTTGKPWMPFARQCEGLSVEEQKNEPFSMLAFYKDLIRLRAQDNVLQEGLCTFCKTDNQKILAYTRTLGKEKRLVLLNFSSKNQSVTLLEEPDATIQYSSLFSTQIATSSLSSGDGKFSLKPYQGTLFLCEGKIPVQA
ncbi:glycosidase [Sphaerochaeta pleomorpha str. Grapes]|uniref:Glycosidase n=1 Tax=Sphaerochaeta pleomorpha (strain ATCC BAA-1885 / DSM 22778 / Grapes) TaxID=158190 RepID=G8QYH7_SPHPG|nr:alpha-amylase family glycosyl hydrolase [Sphaerochaeta pleomorpha]AEV28540.1 glycosidase [Sphaerochaeta pleomorpha str. Grapes]